MARIRTIKPEFFTSLAVASLPLEARLTFIGLWTHADDAGRCVDDPRLIKAAVWPLDDRVSADVEGDLKILTEASLIGRYKVRERSYIWVCNWGEHQRINRPTESKLPPPEDADETDPPPPVAQRVTCPTCTDRPLTDDSVSTHGGLTEGSLPERKGREQGTGINPPALAAVADTPGSQIVTLFAVPDIEVPTNAGTITKEWIDHCTANGVKLPQTIIKRYAAGIGRALRDRHDPGLIRAALGAMLRDAVASRPALLDSYLVRTQQGPERPPARMTRAEAVFADADSPTARLIRDTLSREA